MHKFLDKNLSFFSSLCAIISGLIVGLIIMLITNPAEAFSAFFTILTGGLQEGLISISKMLYDAAPLILTGLSVGFSFKTGLFNIGAPGQLIIGAVVAIIVGVHFTFLGIFQWLVALIFAGICGALWAIIPGLLKAYRNVNEVVSTIMMNYIGLYLAVYLVKLVVYNREKNESLYVNANAVIPSLRLGNLTISFSFIIALLIIYIFHIILTRTVFGYELKAVGFNQHAAKYAGMNSKRNIVLSLVISGALAGLAGGVIYLNDIGRALEVVDVLPNEGYLGIPVALIGLNNPIGIFFAGLFMAYISLGGFYMQIYNFVPEIINVIISSIIYFSALVMLFRILLERLGKRRNVHG
ncbi:MAG: ABC transporter permease [Bacilli bacterium]|nr:ABC transporter permease [Bacilli bacterium]